VEDDLASLRVDYDGEGLDADELGSDPMAAFGRWFEDARDRDDVAEPNAMSLATCSRDAVPSVRMVLLKSVDDERAALGWFTNLEGRKSREALATGRAATCFWWPGSPGRQVRAAGVVEAMPRADVERYFRTRPLEARIGAAASRQSHPIASRTDLDAQAARAVTAGTDVPLPDTWGGFWLVADELEFWQGRAGRLHDRIIFLRLVDGDRIASTAAVDAAGGSEALRAAGTTVVDPRGTRWLRVRLQP
jgi:pyridoxamine 5'-phosphate oxidase